MRFRLMVQCVGLVSGFRVRFGLGFWFGLWLGFDLSHKMRSRVDPSSHLPDRSPSPSPSPDRYVYDLRLDFFYFFFILYPDRYLYIYDLRLDCVRPAIAERVAGLDADAQVR